MDYQSQIFAVHTPGWTRSENSFLDFQSIKNSTLDPNLLERSSNGRTNRKIGLFTLNNLTCLPNCIRSGHVTTRRRQGINKARNHFANTMLSTTSIEQTGAGTIVSNINVTLI